MEDLKDSFVIVFFLVAVFVAVLAPVFQFIDSTKEEIPGFETYVYTQNQIHGDKIFDYTKKITNKYRIETYGDEYVFRDFLGIKIMKYKYDSNEQKHLVSVTIKTASWMRKKLCGLPDKVVWGKEVQSPSSTKQIRIVHIARTIVKLIPLMILIIAAILFWNYFGLGENPPPIYIDSDILYG